MNKDPWTTRHVLMSKPLAVAIMVGYSHWRVVSGILGGAAHLLITGAGHGLWKLARANFTTD